METLGGIILVLCYLILIGIIGLIKKNNIKIFNKKYEKYTHNTNR